MNTSTVNFNIKLRRSRALFAVTSLIYFFAIASILFISVPFIAKLLCITLLLIMAVHTFKYHVLLSADDAIVSLSGTIDKNGKGKARMKLKNGKVIQAKIISAEWLLNYFAIFVLQNNHKKYRTTIAKDAMSQEQIYTLRLYLRSIKV